MIEAGCHDDYDTLKFVSDRRFKLIFVFEPYPKAFELARIRLANFLDIVSLKNVMLMDSTRQVVVHPWEGNIGTGSTIYTPVLESSEKDAPRVFSVMTLDEAFSPDLTGKGALWLDVEPTTHGLKVRCSTD
jgi:hypothetical protein